MSGANVLQQEAGELIGRVHDRLEHIHRQCPDRATPATTLAYAQSLDGCIAAVRGRSLQLSNGQSQRLTHRLRALHDAILVGINTVLSDDPQLTVRLAAGRSPQPIIIDSRLRFPLAARLLRDPCVRPIIATGNGSCAARERELVAAGARVLRLPLAEDGFLDLAGVLGRLQREGVRTVMIEGGARIITSALTQRLADQLVLTIAPRFVGGVRSVEPADGAGGRLPALADPHVQTLAGDLVIHGHLRAEPSGAVAAGSRSGRAADAPAAPDTGRLPPAGRATR